MRTTIAASLALALLFGVPSVAAGAGDDCETYRAASVPLLHPAVDAGHVELCDDDRDGVDDTAYIETRHVPSSSMVTVKNQEKQRTDRQDEQTETELAVAPSNFAKPKIHHYTLLDDEGDDGQPNSIEGEGGLDTRYGDVNYFYFVVENDGDPSPDVVGLAACLGPVCEFAGDHLVPEIPDRIELPPTVIYLQPVGWLP